MSPRSPIPLSVPSGILNIPWLGSQPEIKRTDGLRGGDKKHPKQDPNTVTDFTLHLVKSLTELGPNFT